MNTVNLTGRIVRDVELKQITNGNSVTNLVIAVYDHKDKDGNPVSYFIRIVAWNKIAENLNLYASKGTLIGVVGKIVQTQSKTKKDEKINNYEVQAERIEYLARPKDKGKQLKSFDQPQQTRASEQPKESNNACSPASANSSTNSNSNFDFEDFVDNVMQ